MVEQQLRNYDIAVTRRNLQHRRPYSVSNPQVSWVFALTPPLSACCAALASLS